MDAKIKIKLGLIAAIIATVYYTLGAIGMFALTFLMPKEQFVFGGFFLLHLIPLTVSFLYIFSLIKKRLSIAKWSFYILSVCILFSAMVYIFEGLFVKETSEGLVTYGILFVLIISIPIFLFLFSLRIGINGLEKYLGGGNRGRLQSCSAHGLIGNVEAVEKVRIASLLCSSQ